MERQDASTANKCCVNQLHPLSCDGCSELKCPLVDRGPQLEEFDSVVGRSGCIPREGPYGLLRGGRTLDRKE